METKAAERLVKVTRKLTEAGVDPDYLEIVLPQHAKRIAEIDAQAAADEILATVPEKWKTGKGNDAEHTGSRTEERESVAARELRERMETRHRAMLGRF